MRRALIVFLVLFSWLFAQTTVPEKLLLEVARLQRDLLMTEVRMRDAQAEFRAAKAEYDNVEKMLRAKLGEATKACGAKQIFDSEKLICLDKEKDSK